MATLLLVYAFLLHAFSGVFGGIFQISPNNVTGLNGASLTLSCHANSAPASVRWTFEDAFVETSSSVSTTYEAGDASIVFSPLNYLNEGVYRCIALNSSGNELFRSHPGRVNVFGQPSIVVPPTSVSVVAGSGAEFTCTVTSDPQGSVTWHFNHQQLQSSSKYTIQTNPHRLMIVNVQETDVGYYDCNATNVYGSTFVSARLSIVTAAGNRPVITLSPGDAISAEEGSSQSIGCFTTGEPTPAVYWTRNGMLLAETDQLSITRQAGNSTLSFRALSSSDSGSYQCYANNTHGSDIMTVLLSVLVAPMVTRAPNDVIVRAGETPTESVVCEATGNPPPLINILDPLGRIISTDGSWSPPSLTRSEGGTYMCAASNTVGRTTSSFTVAVQDVPLITRAPQNTVVSIGGEVILSCEAEGPPNPVTIAWMRADGSTLGTTGGELRLFDVSQNDAGVYVCKATNSIGSSTASANVTVLVIPSVSVVPRQAFLRVGDSITFECVVTPLPSSPAYKWYFNSTLLAGETQPNMTLRQAQMQDSGVYRCEIDTYSATATVTVGMHPSVTLVPQPEVVLLPGNQVTLHCMGTGVPPPRLTWEFVDEMDQRSGLGDTANIRVYTNNSLLLLNVNKLLSGRYICVLDNGVGRVEAISVVRVEGAPVVTGIAPPTLVLGQRSRVRCQVIYNFPPASVSWGFPGSSPVATGNELVIDQVATSDGGVYTCTAENSYGRSSLSQVLEIYVLPTAVVANDTVNGYIDGDVELICSGEGVPPPNVTWTSPSGDRTASSTLRLAGVQLTDAGTYTCTATNVVGTNSTTMQLTVQGAPPTGLQAEVVSKTSITLSWFAPLFRSKLLTFRIEYGPTRSAADTYTVVEDNNARTRLDARPLDEGTEYEFEIRGVYLGNHLGEAVTIKVTTDEDVPTAPPQNVTVTTEYYSELTVRWNPPPVTDRNGLITHYNIFYRVTPVDLFQEGDTFTGIMVFSGGQYIIRGLEGNVSYDVMMQAVNSEGGSPNSTIITIRTTRLPLELILGVTIGGGSLLVIIIVVFFICCCYCIWRKRHQGALDVRSGKEKSKNKKKGISGPIADEPPFIDPYNPGKFGVVNQGGELVALQPKIITSYDIAPPPVEGQTAQMVRQVKLKQSAPLDIYSEPQDTVRRESERPPSKEMQVVSEAFDYMNEWDSTGDISPYAERPNSFDSSSTDDLIQPLDVILGRVESNDNIQEQNAFVGSQDKEPVYAQIPKEHVQKKKSERITKNKNKTMQKAMDDYQQRLDEYHPQFDEVTSPLVYNEYTESPTSFDFGMQDMVEVDTTSKKGRRK